LQPGSSAFSQKGAPSPSQATASVLVNITQPNIFPESEIQPDDLSDDELQPHFFTPDFLRPLPEPEEEEDFADEDLQMPEEDLDDAYWLMPGVVPEPYWDLNMGQEFNFA